MSEIPGWLTFAEKLRTAGLNIFASASLAVTEKGFADERVLALTLLARTLSNQKGALLLLREKRIVEARTVARCCFENIYWLVGLIEEGEEFVRKMADDEITHRKNRGQFIFENSIGLEAKVEADLRAWLRNTNKRSNNGGMLHPKQVAGLTDIGRSYVFYSQLSSDAAHPSVSALNRYIVPHTDNEVGGIDVEPPVKEKEIEQTLELLCQAVMGVCIGVNQILGGTSGGNALNALADQYVALSNKSRRDRAAPVS
jgi:hypothetical protein